MRDMADMGGKFIVPTDTNPSSLVSSWQEFGFSEEYASNQMVVRDAILKMGGCLSDTCAPYMTGNVPRMREHVAWNESSAVIFANSVLGARTNREGGPSALAAAIVGRVPEYGLHLDRNRYGEIKIVVTTRLKNLHDYGTLGYFTGKIASDKIPVLTGISPAVSWDALKIMGAAMATSGSIALFHVVGVTPEAPIEQTAFGPKDIKSIPVFEFGSKEMVETEAFLNKAPTQAVDLVSLGCPHASIMEVREYARLLSGKKISHYVEFWITITHMVKAQADVMGYTDIITKSGAQILTGVCPAAVASKFAKDKRSRTLATTSAKLPYYIGQYCVPGQTILAHYGSLKRCVNAAITGKWI